MTEITVATDLFGNKIPEKTKDTRTQLEKNVDAVIRFTGIEKFSGTVNTETVENWMRKICIVERTCTHPQCGQNIFMVLSRKRNPTPFLADGTCHFENCPGSSKFRQKKGS